MCCSSDQRASKVAFDLSEAVPTNSLESHKHQPRFLWQERLSLSKWLRKRSTAVTAFTVIRCRQDWKELLVKSSSTARQQLANLTHPKGPGTCDHNATERGINLVTSLPFFALGWHAFRQAKSDESRLWGASIMGVGAGAMAFHASAGEHRHWGRKLDYWVISLSTAALTRAIYPNVSGHKTAASLLLTPMQPLAVTTLNAAAMEVEFLKQAWKNPELRPAHRVHMGATVLGAGCFVLEDFRPTLPLIHSVWHGLSAVALYTTNALVADADRRKLQAVAEGF